MSDCKMDVRGSIPGSPRIHLAQTDSGALAATPKMGDGSYLPEDEAL